MTRLEHLLGDASPNHHIMNYELEMINKGISDEPKSFAHLQLQTMNQGHTSRCRAVCILD